MVMSVIDNVYNDVDDDRYADDDADEDNGDDNDKPLEVVTKMMFEFVCVCV